MNEKFFSQDVTDGPTSFLIVSDGEEITMNLQSGIQVIPLPEDEKNLEIYQLLEKVCSLYFCKNKQLDNVLFESEDQFAIFATDGRNGLYGTIGGIGDLQSDNYAVGYVNNEGYCGKIANSIKEFLQLIIYYPFWLGLLHCSDDEIQMQSKVLEKEKTSSVPDYYNIQKQIANILCIKKNERSIESLLSTLQQEPRFVVYGKDIAQIKYKRLL